MEISNIRNNNNNSSKNKIISLVEYFLKYNQVPLIQDKFEFKCQSDVLEVSKSSTDKINLHETMMFKYKIETLGVDVERRIKIIKNIRDLTEEELDNWILGLENGN